MSKYSALTPDGRRVLLEVGEYFDRNGVLRQRQPDPQAGRIAELEKEVTRQRAKIQQAEVEMLVSVAIDEGKLLPAQRQWAVEFGRIRFADLRAFVERAPSLAAAGKAKS